MEDTMNYGQTTTDDTATSGTENGQNNNTPNASEGVKPQGTGDESAANKRIRELVEENKRLKAERTPTTPAAEKPQATDVDVVAELRELKLQQLVPAHLKDQLEGMKEYAKRYPNLPLTDVVDLFNSRKAAADAVKDYENKAKDADFTSGGDSNPQARTEAKPLEQMSKEDLEKELIARMAAGEKI